MFHISRPQPITSASANSTTEFHVRKHTFTFIRTHHLTPSLSHAHSHNHARTHAPTTINHESQEDTDRKSFTLPGQQLDLINALHTAAAGKPLVVLLISGGPVAEPSLLELDHTAVLWCSYFGQSGELSLS